MTKRITTIDTRNENGMTVSELVAALEKFRELYGDLPVYYFYDSLFGNSTRIDTVAVYDKNGDICGEITEIFLH